MAEDFGSGVTRTLSALQRQFQSVVWQAGKPPLDSELNLMAQIEADRMSRLVRSSMHSGFIIDPTTADEDFLTDAAWSNFFKLGKTGNRASPVLWANVNGWIIPVAGSSTAEDLSNRIDLFPPPSSDARIDFVFLEAWVTNVAPNPSTSNKPSADRVWKYGNVKFGGTNVEDDIQDPTIGYETTERVQVQYRLRLVGSGSGLGTSVALDDYPDGLDDPNVLAQGTAESPLAGVTFTNMGTELGDPGLWRAGDGDSTNDLGTVDGYTYAIPVCAVFRRNSDVFVARTSSGNANQNGALDRNPTTLSYTDPAEGTEVFGVATLIGAIDETDTGDIQVAGLTGSGFDNTDINWNSTFLLLDDEIISIESVNTGVSPATVRIRAAGGRGRWGTMAVPHAAGTQLRFFNHRHDGLFSDQIVSTDILDMRRSVTMGEWDYQRILQSNLSKLLRGDLRTSYKQGQGDSQGPFVVEVDTLDARGTVTVPNQTEALDGPDGIRTIFSDAAVLQPDVSLLLNDPNTLSGGSSGFVADYTSAATWDVGAGFIPGGFVVDGTGWNNGDVIFLHIGGSDGTGGARGTFRDGSERAVRFVSPQEYWRSQEDISEVGNQYPFTLRFIQDGATDPPGPGELAGLHPGPMHPIKDANFEKPFIVLGGLLNAASQVASSATVHPETNPGVSEDWEVELPGLDFDAAGEWFSKTGGRFNNDPSQVTNPVLHASRTLFSMITQDGRDRTGASSEVYLVLVGDDTTDPTNNNGVFRVVGAGATAGYTNKNATAADRVRVEGITQGWSDFSSATGLTAEFRSQYMHSEDGDGFNSGRAAAAIVITDIEAVAGGSTNPWNGLLAQPVASKMVVNTTLQYHSGRGGTARVADEISRLAVVTAGSEYLRRPGTAQDSLFPSEAGVPSDETYFDLNQIQTWNRLSGLGLDAPDAPAYGGAIVSFTEQDREAEVFQDSGSKTLMFRPYQAKSMTLVRRTTTSALIPQQYTAGHQVDGAGIFPLGRDEGFALPPQYMPRFGRQDIPFFVDTTSGAGTFLNGLNHMFVDTTNATDPQFDIVGGEDTAASGVASILFQLCPTSSTLDYGEYGPVPPGGGGSAIQCRLYENNDVISSDLGRGLKGIQLPPFYGVARIYGIYERTDYENSGATGTMFEADRITPIANAAPNLLRTDADKQTLFIVQGGADDVITGGTGENHTYVIPTELIEFSLSNSFTAGTSFEDYEYVIECVVFGFSQGWINKNTYVLGRLTNGGGAGGTELDGAEMVLPAAAPLNDETYVVYNRVPYQGDPYMTRDGSTRTTSDYEHRYGQIPQGSAVGLANAIQQFDSSGNTIIETPNARALQVLATLDFWTTLGTGKVGGSLFAGTSLDVGHVTNSSTAAARVPSASSDPPWQMETRAFTESQKNNPSKAKLRVRVTDNAAMAGGSGIILRSLAGENTSFTAPGDFTIGADALETAQNIIAAIQASTDVRPFIRVLPTDAEPVIDFIAVVSGSLGQGIQVSINNDAAFAIEVDEPETAIGVVTSSPLQGGVDVPVNSGTGTSSQELTGLTERLPLGILVQDSDFICEDINRDGTGQLQSFMGGVGGVQVATPLIQGQEYTRLVGGTGEFITMSDGSILLYEGYDEALRPSGTRSFRLFRGGGSAYVQSDPRPGGPVDWAPASFPASNQPVLKGGILSCKALLVRNYPETAFSAGSVTSRGDEIQMVVLTRAVFGSGDEVSEGIQVGGIISPTGYGEGYAASDRYRLEGYPLVAGHGAEGPETLDPSDLAIYPFSDLTFNSET